jgi:hypothetical protein
MPFQYASKPNDKIAKDAGQKIPSLNEWFKMQQKPDSQVSHEESHLAYIRHAQLALDNKQLALDNKQLALDNEQLILENQKLKYELASQKDHSAKLSHERASSEMMISTPKKCAANSRNWRSPKKDVWAKIYVIVICKNTKKFLVGETKHNHETSILYNSVQITDIANKDNVIKKTVEATVRAMIGDQTTVSEGKTLTIGRRDCCYIRYVDEECSLNADQKYCTTPRWVDGCSRRSDFPKLQNMFNKCLPKIRTHIKNMS